jgi:tRNA dimethylallyltransferase
VGNHLVTILGCTASGKGGLARALARDLGGEVLSIDSMKVYRGLDIGTAKPTAEQRAAIPHHLIDVADPWEAFSAARFVDLADQAVAEVHARGRPVVAVGGTMLYFKCFYEGMFAGPSADPAIRAEIRTRVKREGVAALHEELARFDPEAAARIHRNDLRRIERAFEVYRLTGKPISTLQRQWDGDSIRRPDWGWVLLGLRWPRDALNRRINDRVRRMVAGGLVEEARRVWSDRRGVSDQARQAVGYAELFGHFEGRLSLEDALEQVKIHTRRLAKQQRTWLKRLANVRWIDVEEGDDDPSVLRRAKSLISLD